MLNSRAIRSPMKIILFMSLLSWSIIWIILHYSDCKLDYRKITQILHMRTESSYLVNSTHCHIPNLNAFNEDAIKLFRPESYDSCTKQPLLTYVTNKDNIVTLHVNDKAIPAYLTTSVVCCYSNVTRKESSDEPDNYITTTECYMFKNNITLYHDTVIVKCFSKERIVIYENTHTTFIMNDEIKEKINRPKNKKQISVLLVGIDSISRLNFIRALPKTYDFVESTGWIPLKGYNKIEDNTLPNLMAILTGHNSSDISDICDPMQLGTMDQCPMLWYDYRDLGYVTSFAEDECSLSTFNYQRRGFTSPPTDFYFRPYMLASEKLQTTKKQGMTYCTGPETSGERIMNLVKDFSLTFKGYPYFGLFWINTFSHNQINTVSGMDSKISHFLKVLAKEDVLEHSVVIFFSDHGIRFGDIRLTETGWLEERLPFMYVSFPPWFKETYRREFNNFRVNSDRLTSPYDLYMTLQHFLVLSGHDYTITQSSGCHKCTSLLEEVDVERSCEEAGIEQHWCTCTGYTTIKLDNDIERNISEYVLNKLHEKMANYEERWMCSRYFLNNIINTSVSQTFSHTNDTNLLIKFSTLPTAVFEATISYKGDISELNFSLSGTISRLDRYYLHSSCVWNTELKKYCYCIEE